MLTPTPQADALKGKSDFTAIEDPRTNGAPRVVLTILWILFAGVCVTGVWILSS